jgi:thiol-disulfide isomerase/thioredoxin
MFYRFSLILIISSIYALSFNLNDKLDQDTINTLYLKKNKIYVVNFFASWCSSCKKELPLILKLNSKLDKSKYKIILVNIDKDISKAKTFIKNMNINMNVIYDTNSNIVSKFNPIGVPALYYIHNNKIKDMSFGAIDNIDVVISKNLNKLNK